MLNEKKTTNMVEVIPIMDIGGLVILAHALQIAFDEDVGTGLARQEVLVLQHHVVRVPDDATQLVSIIINAKNIKWTY